MICLTTVARAVIEKFKISSTHNNVPAVFDEHTMLPALLFGAIRITYGSIRVVTPEYSGGDPIPRFLIGVRAPDAPHHPDHWLRGR